MQRFIPILVLFLGFLAVVALRPTLRQQFKSINAEVEASPISLDEKNLPSKTQCSSWTAWQTGGINSQLSLRICQDHYAGFLKVKNATTKTVSLTLVVTFNDGQSKRWEVNLKPESNSKTIYCYECNDHHNGVKSWHLARIHFK